MVVISLISVLAGMGVVQYRNCDRPRRRRPCCREDLFRMRDAIDQYYADKAKYPASLETLVTDGYLRAGPEGSHHQLHRHLADGSLRARPEQPDGELGIFDVKSGSEATVARRDEIQRVVATAVGRRSVDGQRRQV